MFDHVCVPFIELNYDIPTPLEGDDSSDSPISQSIAAVGSYARIVRDALPMTGNIDDGDFSNTIIPPTAQTAE